MGPIAPRKPDVAAAIVVLATGEAMRAWMSVAFDGIAERLPSASINPGAAAQPYAGSGLVPLGEADIQGEDETLSTW